MNKYKILIDMTIWAIIIFGVIIIYYLWSRRKKKKQKDNQTAGYAWSRYNKQTSAGILTFSLICMMKRILKEISTWIYSNTKM